MDFLFYLKEHPQIYLAAAALAAVCLFLVVRYLRRPLPKKIEARIRRKRYCSKDAFFRDWKNNKKDFPGCYVVLIYDKKLILNPMHYDDIYVGQSVGVRKRVFSHLMGHGNGNVYYGLKSGCRIFVIIQKCRRKKLNQAEKDLIAYFNATASLNMTRGGAVQR